MSALDGIGGPKRAAMVLLSVNPEVAKKVLGRMEPEQAKRLWELVEAMPMPSEREQQAVLKHFERLMRDPTPLKLTHAGKYLRDLATSAYGAQAFDNDEPEQIDMSPIGVIRRAPPATLAGLLAEEHPQVAAAIVSQLETELAASILMLMEETPRVEIVGRLASLEKIPKELVDEASMAVAENLAKAGIQEPDEGDLFEGKAFAAGILKNLNEEDTEILLDGVAERFGEIAETLRDAMFAFEDLVDLTTPGLQALMREVPSDQLLPALKTASPALVDKLFSVVSSRAAEALREDLELLKPMRLSEVEEAQRTVVEVAMRLAEEGRIDLPRGGNEELV